MNVVLYLQNLFDVTRVLQSNFCKSIVGKFSQVSLPISRAQIVYMRVFRISRHFIHSLALFSVYLHFLSSQLNSFSSEASLLITKTFVPSLPDLFLLSSSQLKLHALILLYMKPSQDSLCLSTLLLLSLYIKTPNIDS